MRWGLSVCIILGITFTTAYAYEVSYPSINYRVQHPPTYCISESDDDSLVPLANDAVANWQKNLQDEEFENPKIWKIDSKIIPTGGTKSGCDVTVYFIPGAQESTSDNMKTLGKFIPDQNKIEIYYSNVNTSILFNVILHEIGHSLGLGHYIADDDDVNKKFYTSDKLAPSLMIPTTHSNPNLIKITQIDVEKIRSIYGSQGFYAFSGLVPPPPEKQPTPSPLPTPLPTPSPLPTPTPSPELPLQPISPFKSLKITEDQIIVEKYHTKTVKIQGQIDKQLYQKGHPVYILIIKPDQTTEVHRLPVAGSGYFEVPISFDSTDPYGIYTVEGSYMEYTDERTNFEFSIIHDMYERYDTPTKPITKLVPKADNPDKTMTEKPKTTETKKQVKPITKQVKSEPKKSKDLKTVKVERGQTINEKISGAIPMGLYKKGKPADVAILHPDGKTEMQKITVNSKGKFEHPFSITDKTIPGKYEITISYSGNTVKKFTYEIRN